MENYDMVIKGGSLVIPFVGVQKSDIGIKDEKIAVINRDIPAANAETVIDASNKYVFPGAVDSHFQILHVLKTADSRRCHSGSQQLSDDRQPG